jgi:hypothetical protein
MQYPAEREREREIPAEQSYSMEVFSGYKSHPLPSLSFQLCSVIIFLSPI